MWSFLQQIWKCWRCWSLGADSSNPRCPLWGCFHRIWSSAPSLHIPLQNFNCSYLHNPTMNNYIWHLPDEMIKLNFTSSGGYLVFDPIGLVSHSLYSILLQRLMQPVSCPNRLEFMVANLSARIWYLSNSSLVKHSFFPPSLFKCQGMLHPISWLI